MDFAIAFEAPGEIQILRPLPGGIFLDLFRQVRVVPRGIVSWGSTEPARVYPWGSLEASLQIRAANPSPVRGKKVAATEVARRRRRLEVQEKALYLARGLPAYGYEVSLPIIQQLRQSVSIRSVYLCFLFGMFSANAPAATAEEQLAAVGPLLVAKLDAGIDPILTPEEVRAYWVGPGREQRVGFINDFGPSIRHAHAQIAAGWTNRKLRRHIAMIPPGLPPGTALVKGSFALECLGHNVACLDIWMVRWMLGAFRPGKSALAVERDYNKVATMMERWNNRKQDGSMTLATVKNYERWEDRLKESPHYREGDPFSLARAHWMLWEDIHGEATAHAPLFRVISAP